jgi:hypothetical protein
MCVFVNLIDSMINLEKICTKVKKYTRDVK